MSLAHQSLTQVRGVESDTEAELNDIINYNEASKALTAVEPYKKILLCKYQPHLILTMAISSFPQLTGINEIVFYAPAFFLSIGFGSNSALIGAIIIGTVNLKSTFVSAIMVDRYG